MRGMLTLNLSFLVQSIAIARPTIAHTALQQTGALRDFRRVYVRFGSGADVTCQPANVGFASQSGQARSHLGMSAIPIADTEHISIENNLASAELIARYNFKPHSKNAL